MDIEQLQREINSYRTASVLLTLNRGGTEKIPPGSVAYLQGMDTLLILWPGHETFKVTRSMYLAAINVAKFKLEHQAA